MSASSFSAFLDGHPWFIHLFAISLVLSATLYLRTPCRRTKEMMQSCPIHLHVISLVYAALSPLRSSIYRTNEMINPGHYALHVISLVALTAGEFRLDGPPPRLEG